MKVLVAGTFDGFHPGHLHYFEQAKKQGDYLMVVVARDSIVERERGSPPVINEDDRLALVKSIRHVDFAVLGNETDKLKTVEDLRPDIICLGYDQNVDEKQLKGELEKRGIRITIKRMLPYKPQSCKSRNLFL